jgi:hypothetical protein
MNFIIHLLPAVISLLFLILGDATSVQTLTVEQCAEYGFNSNILQCSTCSYVSEFFGEESEGLTACKGCCIQKVEEKYAKAVLEIDRRALPFFPELKAVVEKKKELKFTVKNRYGSPRLLMYKLADDHEPSERMAVHNWNRDTFIDYLKSHLTS